MRLRILYTVCVLCGYLKFFRASFNASSYQYMKMLVHGMIYLEGQVNCKRISECWQEEVWHQRLIDFLNHGKYNLNQVNEDRFNQLLPLALKHPKNRDVLSKYVMFSIDPTNFKKYKDKQMQGVHYTGDGEGIYKAHSMVMSCFIYGSSCIPFKKILYWGSQGVPKGRQIPKSQIYLKLARKAEKIKVFGKKRIAVFDGEGCSKKVLPYFHKSPEWSGFVTKFPRTRNIVVAGKSQHIRRYLSGLKNTEFPPMLIGNKEVYYHELEVEVPSLAFLGRCRRVVIQDEPGNVDQKTMRVLITDVMDLTVEQILTIYRRRWKEETYHQIIKDRLGVKTYKHRRLKAIMRFLELADVAYCFLEYRRLKDKVWESSLSEVRNALIRKAEYRLCVKFNLQLPKRLVVNG